MHKGKNTSEKLPAIALENVMGKLVYKYNNLCFRRLSADLS